MPRPRPCPAREAPRYHHYLTTGPGQGLVRPDRRLGGGGQVVADQPEPVGGGRSRPTTCTCRPPAPWPRSTRPSASTSASTRARPASCARPEQELSVPAVAGRPRGRRASGPTSPATCSSPITSPPTRARARRTPAGTSSGASPQAATPSSAAGPGKVPQPDGFRNATPVLGLLGRAGRHHRSRVHAHGTAPELRALRLHPAPAASGLRDRHAGQRRASTGAAPPSPSSTPSPRPASTRTPRPTPSATTPPTRWPRASSAR